MLQAALVVEDADSRGTGKAEPTSRGAATATSREAWPPARQACTASLGGVAVAHAAVLEMASQPNRDEVEKLCHSQKPSEKLQ